MESEDTHNDMFIDNSMAESSLDEFGCLLCEKSVKEKDFPKIIDKALSRKYCSNLNAFFYTKDINKILNKTRCRARTQLKEWLTYDFENEYLKRYYKSSEFSWKLNRLENHYKKTVFAPKIYIKEVSRTTRKYYYFQEYIKRFNRMPMLEDEYDTDTVNKPS